MGASAPAAVVLAVLASGEERTACGRESGISSNRVKAAGGVLVLFGASNSLGATKR